MEGLVNFLTKEFFYYLVEYLFLRAQFYLMKVNNEEKASMFLMKTDKLVE